LPEPGESAFIGRARPHPPLEGSAGNPPNAGCGERGARSVPSAIGDRSTKFGRLEVSPARKKAHLNVLP
jgi:hypothetical protein